MSIPTPTTHRIAALVLLIGCLVLLADQTARTELAQAVASPWQSGAHSIAFTVSLRN